MVGNRGSVTGQVMLNKLLYYIFGLLLARRSVFSYQWAVGCLFHFVIGLIC